MFERIKIEDIPTEGEASISASLAVPRGWQQVDRARWWAFHPPGRRTQGFALLMSPEGEACPERLLCDLDGLGAYLEAEMPALEQRPSPLTQVDHFAPYELACFAGRVDGVGGRVVMLATALRIEDVNFALVGFSRDEVFEEVGPVFQHMIMSFQPLVLG